MQWHNTVFDQWKVFNSAPGITCAAAPTHGGAVCVFVVSVVRCVCGNEEGGVAVP